MKKMIMLMAIVAAITLFSACSDVFGLDNDTLVEVRINGEGVSNHAVKIELGKPLKLTLNEIASDREFEAVWESLDERIATIDANGIVTPVTTGEVKITGYIKNATTPIGDYIMATVVHPSLDINIIDDNLEQSLAE